MMTLSLHQALHKLPRDHAIAIRIVDDSAHGIPRMIVGEVLRRAPGPGWPSMGAALGLPADDARHRQPAGLFAWDDVVIVSITTNEAGARQLEHELAQAILDREWAEATTSADAGDDGSVCDVCHGDDTCTCEPEDTEGAYG